MIETDDCCSNFVGSTDWEKGGSLRVPKIYPKRGFVFTVFGSAILAIALKSHYASFIVCYFHVPNKTVFLD